MLSILFILKAKGLQAKSGTRVLRFDARAHLLASRSNPWSVLPCNDLGSEIGQVLTNGGRGGRRLAPMVQDDVLICHGEGKGAGSQCSGNIAPFPKKVVEIFN